MSRRWEGDSPPIKLNLAHARVQASSISQTGIIANIGGMISQTERTAEIQAARGTFPM